MSFDDPNDLHRRIAPVTEDSAHDSAGTHCAAMQAPSDPGLMAALSSLSEAEPIETRRVVLDRMRHFPWFIPGWCATNPSLKLRSAEPAADRTVVLNQLSRADEIMLPTTCAMQSGESRKIFDRQARGPLERKKERKKS